MKFIILFLFSFIVSMVGNSVVHAESRKEVVFTDTGPKFLFAVSDYSLTETLVVVENNSVIKDFDVGLYQKLDLYYIHKTVPGKSIIKKQVKTAFFSQSAYRRARDGLMCFNKYESTKKKITGAHL